MITHALLVLIVALTILNLVLILRPTRQEKREQAAITGALGQRALELVREQETRWPDRSGQAKNHQVRAQLMDDFPGIPGRALSRAIEDAVDHL